MPDINTSISWAITKCNDSHVGYSQSYRNQQTVNGITYYDCSSFVWYSLIAGGFDCVTANGGSSWPFVTDTMPTVLTNLGFQTVSKTGELKPGDICIKTGHTEMVYEGGTGTARTMGAHNGNVALANQVSINNYWTSGNSWESIYRYGGGGDTQVTFGVDVSEHNGNIDWGVTKDHIDFAIIRAGYGNNHVDAKFIANADGCTQNAIPFGVYWFSYALSIQDCIDEANSCCNLCSSYSLNLPIFYDWEYDSDDYASSQGVVMTNNLRSSFARAFMSTVQTNGYNTGLYTNPDYIITKGFDFILTESQYMLWLAEWNVQNPRYEAPIWQYGQGTIQGIPTTVDLNKMTGLTPKPSNPKKFKWWMYLRYPPF